QMRPEQADLTHLPAYCRSFYTICRIVFHSFGFCLYVSARDFRTIEQCLSLSNLLLGLVQTSYESEAKDGSLTDDLQNFSVWPVIKIRFDASILNEGLK